MKLPVGLQLYSIRNETQKDFLGALEKVAEIGYKGVEFAGYGDIPAKEMKAALDRLGLKAAASHIDIEILRDRLDEAMEYSLEIGSKYVICPGNVYKSKKDFIDTAQFLQTVGEKCMQKGLVLGYHNHDHEFVKFDDEYGLDILFRSADPKLLAAEIDTCWAYCGGVDPVEYVKKYTSRCPLVHIKDVKSRVGMELTEVGTGVVNIRGVAAAAAAAGAEWLIVEQDVSALPPIESVRISFENMKHMGLA